MSSDPIPRLMVVLFFAIPFSPHNKLHEISSWRNMGIFGGLFFRWGGFPSLWILLHSFYGVIVTREELQGMPCTAPMAFIWQCLWIRELPRNGALTVKVTLQWKQYEWTLWKYSIWKNTLRLDKISILIHLLKPPKHLSSSINADGNDIQYC